MRAMRCEKKFNVLRKKKIRANQANKYMFKVNNKNTICLKSTIKLPETRY